MTTLGDFQRGFTRALLEPTADAAPAAFDEAGRRRFRVYRNNVHHGLSEALADAYPIVKRLVGDTFFKAMAQAFVLQSPPRSRSLALYGGGFAEWIEAFPPAASVAYLADVARLERAMLESLHSADGAPLDANAIPALGEAIAEAIFVPLAATRLVVSTHPVVALWRGQHEGAAEVRVEARAETALVTRPGDNVHVRAVDTATGAFAAALFGGVSPTLALGDALRFDPAFDPQAAFQHLLSAGALAAVVPPAS